MDIDVFLMSNGESKEDCELVWEEVIRHLDEYKEEKFFLVRYANVLNCISQNGKKPIQFVFKNFECMEQALLFSDLDCTRFIYDGQNVYTIGEGLRALKSYKIVANPKLKKKLKFTDRVYKYHLRGYKTSFENLPLLQPFKTPNSQIDFNVDDYIQEIYPSGQHFYFDELIEVIKGNTDSLSMSKRNVIQRSKDFTVVKSANDLFILNASNLITEFYPAQDLLSLQRIVKCYICNYHRYLPPDDANVGLCSKCNKENSENRNISKDLRGKFAIVTGGRVKVGYAVALKLLRMNAKVVVTSRFPVDTLSRFEKETDYKKFRKNLEIYPLDLKSLEHVVEFTKYINDKFPRIHILINNAAQTVRKPLPYYKKIIQEEKKLLLSIEPKKQKNNHVIMENDKKRNNIVTKPFKSHLEITTAPLLPEDKLSFRHSSRKDRFGDPIDSRSFNSWTYTLDQVDPREIAETNMINSIAPAVIISKLTEKMRIKDKCNSYIINFTSHEGRFNVEGKTDDHIHNNMSKAGLNMLTRSSAHFYAKKGILMNAVDPGWISSAFNTFIDPPLSCEDGASRILHPILTDSKDYGKLFKDYKEVDW